MIQNHLFPFGIGDNRVDDASSGGLFCGISDSGKLVKICVNTSGACNTQHPDGLLF